MVRIAAGTEPEKIIEGGRSITHDKLYEE